MAIEFHEGESWNECVFISVDDVVFNGHKIERDTYMSFLGKRLMVEDNSELLRNGLRVELVIIRKWNSDSSY